MNLDKLKRFVALTKSAEKMENSGAEAAVIFGLVFGELREQVTNQTV